MKKSSRLGLSLLSGLVLAALFGGYGFAGPSYHPHDVMSPIIYGFLGALLGCGLGIAVAILLTRVKRQAERDER
jgi:hypothetical protein